MLYQSKERDRDSDDRRHRVIRFFLGRRLGLRTARKIPSWRIRSGGQLLCLTLGFHSISLDRWTQGVQLDRTSKTANSFHVA